MTSAEFNKMFKTTTHTHAVSNAFKGYGFTCVSDGANEYQSVKNFRRQVWVREVSPDREVRFHVDYNKAGHVTGYSSGAGYAHTHDEGRSGGVWRRRFTPAMCRDLLLDNLRDMVTGDWQLARASQPKRVSA
jgi:hypothetical protein